MIENGEKDKKRGEVLVGIPSNPRGHIKRAHPTWLDFELSHARAEIVGALDFLISGV